MRVGSELKAARKKAGITVEVMSKRTKISVSKLVALEKNDVKNLPTGLYLFSTVRAYAREVRIDPEPIVERLRAEFADKDALDALHALDATGALGAKNLADAGRSKSNILRNVAIAAGVVLMAAAGAGAGAYLHNTGRIAHEVSLHRDALRIAFFAISGDRGCNCGRCAAASCRCSPKSSTSENPQAEAANCRGHTRAARNPTSNRRTR